MSNHPERNGTPALAPLSASAALDAYFHEARSKLLDLAAFLDRVERGPNAAAIAKDSRLAKIRQALEIIRAQDRCRAEQVQQLFSLDYDPAWELPKPR